MCEPVIVLRPTGLQMVDELLPRRRIEALEVLIREGAQQSFGLVEPAGVRWCIERLQTRMAGEVRVGFVGNM